MLMDSERSLAKEITEGFKALEQLGLAESLIKQLDLEIERLKATIAQMTIDSGKEIKPAKYTDAWWKEVEEFNKQLKELNK
jgi:hypothetical protein